MLRVMTVVAGMSMIMLAVAAVALGAAAPRAVGEGAFAGGAGETRIAVHAIAAGSGVGAAGRVRITTDLWTATVEVGCLARIGDLVLVGGIVTETTAPAGPGDGAVVVLDDRGPAHAGGVDRVGFGFGPPEAAVACAVDPAIFPLHELDAGNFVTMP